jgi:hypothetical protein
MHIIIPNVFGVSFLVYDVAPNICHKQCSEHKLGEPRYLVKLTKHALPITISKSREVFTPLVDDASF